MAKRNVVSSDRGFFTDQNRKRHLRLFLPKYLAEEAERLPIDAATLERVTAALNRWADAVEQGHLKGNETTLDAEFLQKIFGEALGYRSVTESPNDYHWKKNPTVPGTGIADGALGHFVSGKEVAPAVIIELKGTKTDLDHDKTNGRSAVDQCWDYLNQLPETQWGIVSNYASIRLYHKGSPKRAYEEFTVAEFRDPARLRQFYYIFERYGLIGPGGRAGGIPRAVKLLSKTQNQQREVGDKLYKYYAEQRHRLIGELMDKRSLPQDVAIRAAQMLLDRIIFIAFCEDRGLLPEKLLENTWKNVPPLARAGYRWSSFLDMFAAIDTGHPALDLPTGYNGGLFKKDPVIDDLTLEGDPWTEIFKNIGSYDFRPEGEINVEVLGHLFERSITELEKYRAVGLFGKQAEQAIAAMPKSAERKRFGTYYTPPEFTNLIVEETLGRLIAERVESLPDIRARVGALRELKVVDPACGSGAFLIAAYHRFEDAYEDVARLLRIDGHLQEAINLINAYPDYILADNLYGVDLSAEAVEITQLALWIRSARKGVPLTDLSKNIKRGNSLIRDKSVHPEAFDWVAAFPTVFGQPERPAPSLRPAGCMPPPFPNKELPADHPTLPVAGHGFDVVVGNPPWERMKLEEREFFGLSAPEIATSANASDRAKLIAKMEEADPALWGRYQSAKANAERMLAHVRTEAAGYPLTGKGDVNTYMLFSELARKLVSPRGRIGLLLPSGIATDKTTKEFFNDIVETKSLRSIYDFVNRLGLFADVEGRLKFCVLLMNGLEMPSETLDFVFWAEKIEDLANKNQHISLTAKDLKLMNPNTRTCPIFRNNRDAAITSASIEKFRF